MLESLQPALVQALKLPPEPPAPFGEEQSLRVFRAAPQFRKYQMILWWIGQAAMVFPLLSVLAVLIGGSIKAGNAFLSPLLALLALIVVMLYMSQLVITRLSIQLHYEMRWYKVTDRSLRIREGVFFVREMTMTFQNIQNIEISQGPIQRWLGIADVQVHTAGGGGAATVQSAHGGNQQVFNMHIGYFRGVDNAAEIVAMMKDRLRKYRSAGLGDHEEHLQKLNGEVAGTGTCSPEVVNAARGLLEEVRAFRRAV